MNKEKALKVILEAAKQYDKNLVNNNLLFVSCDKHRKINSFSSRFLCLKLSSSDRYSFV